MKQKSANGVKNALPFAVDSIIMKDAAQPLISSIWVYLVRFYRKIQKRWISL